MSVIHTDPGCARESHRDLIQTIMLNQLLGRSGDDPAMRDLMSGHGSLVWACGCTFSLTTH